jgi:hypothetical protein
VSLRAGIDLPFSGMEEENGEPIEICFWGVGTGTS